MCVRCNSKSKCMKVDFIEEVVYLCKSCSKEWSELFKLRYPNGASAEEWTYLWRKFMDKYKPERIVFT